MTTPTSGGMPSLPNNFQGGQGNNPTNDVAMNELVEKVSKATGSSAESNIKSASSTSINPVTPPPTLSPNPRIAIESVKNQRYLLQRILQEHPSWETQIKSWKNVSLEDTIWLLQIYELRYLGVPIPQIDALHKTTIIPDASTPNLLQPQTKMAIEESLSKVEVCTYRDKSLLLCPEAIGLLVNLKELNLENTGLRGRPDFSRNVKLEVLNLNRNDLSMAPDVSQNVNLKVLYLGKNKISVVPDVSRNVKLEKLGLLFNHLSVPPDVTQNVNLVELSLGYNPMLSVTPNVSQNVKLEYLNLTGCSLKVPPDVTRNVNLNYLSLCGNQLTVPPDVSQNVKLETLDLRNNAAVLHPDISKNVNMKRCRYK